MGRLITLRSFADSACPEPHAAAWFRHPSDWVSEVEKREGDFRWLHHIIAEAHGDPVGFCQYCEYVDGGEGWYGSTDIDGADSIDYLIGEAAYLNKGLGKAIVLELVARITAGDNAGCVIVQPEPENRASGNTLLSYGFHYAKKRIIPAQPEKSGIIINAAPPAGPRFLSGKESAKVIWHRQRSALLWPHRHAPPRSCWGAQG